MSVKRFYTLLTPKYITLLRDLAFSILVFREVSPFNFVVGNLFESSLTVDTLFRRDPF